MTAYTSNIQFIQPGEPVTAAVTNRPARQLAQRTDSLRKTLETASAGEALILRDVPVDTSVTAGMPVYWKSSEKCCFPACTGAETECSTGEFIAGPYADCLGIVQTKNSTTSADVILSGVVDLPAIRNFLPEGTGRFFLGSDPGTLTFRAYAVQSPVGVLLGGNDACDTRVRVYVHPEYTGRVFEHVHYSHTLARENWKSAANFPNAPEGTVYGYDLTADADLKRLFPPIPIEAVACTVDWDGNTDTDTVLPETFGGKDIPVNTPGCLIRVNNSGIWWMRSDLKPVEPDNNSNGSPYRGFRVTLHFSRVQYGNERVYVTRLEPEVNQPFEFVNCSGEPAVSGDLYARFTLAGNKTDSTVFTGKAVKEMNSSWVQEQVPVIHGLSVSGRGVTVTGSTFTQAGTTYYNGLLNIRAVPYAEDYELAPQVVKLSEALESTWQDMQYLALPHSRNSSITMKMEVPGVFGDNLTVKMRFTCLAKTSGTYPNLVLRYIRLPRPSDGPVSLAGLTSFTSVTWNPGISVTANTLFELSGPEISVSEGDTLIWRLERSGSDSYGSEVGILRASGILNAD